MSDITHSVQVAGDVIHLRKLVKMAVKLSRECFTVRTTVRILETSALLSCLV